MHWASINNLSRNLKQPHFKSLLTDYLNNHPNYPDITPNYPLPAAWYQNLKISTYPSALAVFHSPSDSASLQGMHRERIRAVSSWRNGPGCYDTVLVKGESGVQILGQGLAVARVQLFFSFSIQNKDHHCALITDYALQGTSPDPDTRLWVISKCHPPKPHIIPLDHILCAAHLIPVYRTTKVPKDHDFTHTLSKYHMFYVNKYADYHSFEVAG